MFDIFSVVFKDESSRVVGDWSWDFYPGVGMFMWAEQSLRYSSEEREGDWFSSYKDHFIPYIWPGTMSAQC